MGTLRATSRGYLTLRSSDPRDHPIIEPNYLQTEQDRIDMRQCVKLTREIFAQKAFDPFRGPELQPGKFVLAFSCSPYLQCDRSVQFTVM